LSPGQKLTIEQWFHAKLLPNKPIDDITSLALLPLNYHNYSSHLSLLLAHK
jgi:hypothetical protein